MVFILCFIFILYQCVRWVNWYHTIEAKALWEYRTDLYLQPNEHYQYEEYLQRDLRQYWRHVAVRFKYVFYDTDIFLSPSDQSWLLTWHAEEL